MAWIRVMNHVMQNDDVPDSVSSSDPPDLKTYWILSDFILTLRKVTYTYLLLYPHITVCLVSTAVHCCCQHVKVRCFILATLITRHNIISLVIVVNNVVYTSTHLQFISTNTIPLPLLLLILKLTSFRERCIPKR